MRSYSIRGSQNTINDLLARYSGRMQTEKNKIMYESLKTHLNQAAAISSKNIIEYENALLQVEKELFKKELICSSISIANTLEEYNDLLEKACREEIKQHDLILSTCIASRMKAITEIKIEQLISKFNIM